MSLSVRILSWAVIFILRLYEVFFYKHLTFLDAKNFIPFATCFAAITRFAMVNLLFEAKSSVVQVGSNMCLFFRRNSSKLPCEQYSMIMYSFRHWVQAPRTLTMFSCCPTCMIIFSSPARLRMSSKLGLSGNENISKTVARIFNVA